MKMQTRLDRTCLTYIPIDEENDAFSLDSPVQVQSSQGLKDSAPKLLNNMDEDDRKDDVVFSIEL